MSVISARRTLATALAALLAGFFLTTGAAPAHADPAVGALVGWVTDIGGMPLEGVPVTLEPGGHQQISDPAGRVEFGGLPSAMYTIRASATLDGNCPVRTSMRVAIDQYELLLGLRMFPVFEDPCAPAEGQPWPAKISGIVSGGRDAVLTLEPGGEQTTANEWGGYTFFDVLPGAYTLTTTIPGGECGLTATAEVVLTGQQDEFADLDPQPAPCS